MPSLCASVLDPHLECKFLEFSGHSSLCFWNVALRSERSAFSFGWKSVTYVLWLRDAPQYLSLLHAASTVVGRVLDVHHLLATGQQGSTRREKDPRFLSILIQKKSLHLPEWKMDFYCANPLRSQGLFLPGAEPDPFWQVQQPTFT